MVEQQLSDSVSRPRTLGASVQVVDPYTQLASDEPRWEPYVVASEQNTSGVVEPVITAPSQVAPPRTNPTTVVVGVVALIVAVIIGLFTLFGLVSWLTMTRQESVFVPGIEVYAPEIEEPEWLPDVEEPWIDEPEPAIPEPEMPAEPEMPVES